VARDGRVSERRGADAVAGVMPVTKWANLPLSAILKREELSFDSSSLFFVTYRHKQIAFLAFHSLFH